jgi:hypothetical protein
MELKINVPEVEGVIFIMRHISARAFFFDKATEYAG